MSTFYRRVGAIILLFGLTLLSANAKPFKLPDNAFSGVILMPISDELFEEDRIVFRNKYYGLCYQSPLGPYLENEGWSPLIERDETFSPRGYEAHWVIENNALYLDGFSSATPQVTAYFQDLLLKAQHRWLAYWFSGRLVLALDARSLEYNDRLNDCNSEHRKTLVLIFKHGLLKNIRRIIPMPGK